LEGALFGQEEGAHSQKPIVVDKNRRIGYLSPPAEGKKQDYGMFKDLFPPGLLPESITLWLDRGFKGVESDYPAARV
jgi:hypothetical protein